MDVVTEAYDGVASNSKSCCVSSVTNGARIGYDDEDARYAGTSLLGVGCGVPVKFAKIKEKEIVVDLGCGAGGDAFLAFKATRGGRVVGVDASVKMIERARARGNELGLRQPEDVEFILAALERVPLASASVDCVLSNCVINLCENKIAALSEAYRVLKPNGRLAIADVVSRGKTLPESMRTAEALVC